MCQSNSKKDGYICILAPPPTTSSKVFKTIEYQVCSERGIELDKEGDGQKDGGRQGSGLNGGCNEDPVCAIRSPCQRTYLFLLLFFLFRLYFYCTCLGSVSFAFRALIALLSCMTSRSGGNHTAFHHFTHIFKHPRSQHCIPLSLHCHLKYCPLLPTRWTHHLNTDPPLERLVAPRLATALGLLAAGPCAVGAAARVVPPIPPGPFSCSGSIHATRVTHTVPAFPINGAQCLTIGISGCTYHEGLEIALPSAPPPSGTKPLIRVLINEATMKSSDGGVAALLFSSAGPAASQSYLLEVVIANSALQSDVATGSAH